MFYQEKVHEEDTIKQETPGVEESTVIVVECKVEINEENMDTDESLNVQGKYQANTFIYVIYLCNALKLCPLSDVIKMYLRHSFIASID